MKKFFLFFTALLLAFGLINWMYVLLLPAIDWDFGKTKEAHRFNNQQLDILVLGNSTAMDGINTEILSAKLGPAYNFSVGGASLETNYIQLQHYLQHNAIPKKVLVFLSSAHIAYVKTNEVNPIIDFYYADSFKSAGIKDIPLFKFRWLFLENIKKLLSANHRSARVIKGQLSIKSIVPDDSKPRATPVACKDANFYNYTGYEYLWRIAALCKQKGIPIEVFEMPCWKEVQNNCGDLKVYHNFLKDSLHIRNLNNASRCDTLLNPKQDWLSRNHLNYNGAIKVTNEVANLLMQ